MFENSPFQIPSFINTVILFLIAIVKLTKRDLFLKHLLITFSLYNISIFAILLVLLQRFIGATMGETFLVLSSTFSFFILWVLFRDRDKNFAILLSFLSFVFLIISQYYFYERSIFSPISDIINNNLWIIIHVFSIIVGYGLIIVSSFLSHVTILMKLISGKESDFKNNKLEKIKKFTNIGITLICIGTILGSVWAKIAWGRFWDWDPKEIAVSIVIVSLLIGKILERIFKNNYKIILFTPIIAFILILYTWIGINLLQTGIHSYGFSETGLLILLSFSILELLFLVFLLVDKLLIFNSLSKKE